MHSPVPAVPISPAFTSRERVLIRRGRAYNTVRYACHIVSAIQRRGVPRSRIRLSCTQARVNVLVPVCMQTGNVAVRHAQVWCSAMTRRRLLTGTLTQLLRIKPPPHPAIPHSKRSVRRTKLAPPHCRTNRTAALTAGKYYANYRFPDPTNPRCRAQGAVKVRQTQPLSAFVQAVWFFPHTGQWRCQVGEATPTRSPPVAMRAVSLPTKSCVDPPLHFCTHTALFALQCAHSKHSKVLKI
ncbi:hypothetical protein EK21DRAFT_90326 [Setomelanomma holmii]|uniref:Uncharacterized protein n=1 Tax=Setomelanomma holmii TaxID=210430 RepID=A0A9P4H8E2_9PLEO|nr:hypothetical protein EK21DRAFT_90326 [Setomelanomma holmii]